MKIAVLYTTLGLITNWK